MKQIISILLVLLSLEITGFSQADQTNSLNPKAGKAQPLSFRSENEEKFSLAQYQQEQERLLANLRDKCYQNAEPGNLFKLQNEQQAMTSKEVSTINTRGEIYETPIKRKAKKRKIGGFFKVLGTVVGYASLTVIGTLSSL
jgi:hypothetical protein